MSSEKLPHYLLEPPAQGESTFQGVQGHATVSQVAQNYRDQCRFMLSCASADSYFNYYLVFAQCAMGNHERKTEYGMCGIITAVVSFKLVCQDGIIHLESNFPFVF